MALCGTLLSLEFDFFSGLDPCRQSPQAGAEALSVSRADMTQVERNVGPKVATFNSQGKSSERAACRVEAVRLAYGRDTKPPDCRDGLLQAASDRHDSCHTTQSR